MTVGTVVNQCRYKNLIMFYILVVAEAAGAASRYGSDFYQIDATPCGSGFLALLFNVCFF
jgi:hypothetical protein